MGGYASKVPIQREARRYSITLSSTTMSLSFQIANTFLEGGEPVVATTPF